MLTTLTPSCAVVMKSGNLNFLEPSGTLQAYYGTALPLSVYNNITIQVLGLSPVCIVNWNNTSQYAS